MSIFYSFEITLKTLRAFFELLNTVLTQLGLTGTLLVVSCFIVSFYLWKSTRPRYLYKTDIPPYPCRPWPFFGHLLLLLSNPRVTFSKWRRQCGDMFSLDFCGKHVVVLNGYDVLKEVLIKHADLVTVRPRTLMAVVLDEHNKGIINASGRVWKEQRTASLTILRNFGMGKNIMSSKIREEVDVFLAEIAKLEGRPTNIRVLTGVSISNVICSIIMGKKFEHSDPFFRQMIGLVSNIVTHIGGTALLNHIPALRHLPGDIFRARELERNVREIGDVFVGPVIEKHKKNFDPNVEPLDFIDAYLSQMYERDHRKERPGRDGVDGGMGSGGLEGKGGDGEEVNFDGSAVDIYRNKSVAKLSTGLSNGGSGGSGGVGGKGGSGGVGGGSGNAVGGSGGGSGGKGGSAGGSGGSGGVAGSGSGVAGSGGISGGGGSICNINGRKSITWNSDSSVSGTSSNRGSGCDGEIGGNTKNTSSCNGIDGVNSGNFNNNVYFKKGKTTTLNSTLNEENLASVIKNIFAAGSETTGSTIMWCLLFLLHHPEKQDKLYSQIEAEVGTERSPEMSDRSRLTYLTAVIMETQRIASIAPFSFQRVVAKDIKVKGFTIPEGSVIIPSLDSVLLDEELWGDPFSFRPERFLDENGTVVQPEYFVPFSMGKRVCIGESLAKMELFLYLSSLLQRYKVVPVQDGSLPEIRAKFGMTCAPEEFSLRLLERG